jgi:hypothetical protein
VAKRSDIQPTPGLTASIDKRLSKLSRSYRVLHFSGELRRNEALAYHSTTEGDTLKVTIGLVRMTGLPPGGYREHSSALTVFDPHDPDGPNHVIVKDAAGKKLAEWRDAI